MKRWGGVLQVALRVLLSLLLLLSAAFGAMALAYQLAWPVVGQYTVIVLWCVLALVCLVLLWRHRQAWALCGYGIALTLLLVWWAGLQPSNERQWAADVARMSSGEVEGDRLIMHNVRNFTWLSDDEFEERWETREYDLQQLASVDVITSYWGMPAIAHVLVSFGFSDGQQLLFSVEIRKKKGQKYSEIGGFFKSYELSIVATDERDALRVRTNVRNEDAYLYRLNMPALVQRELLLSYVAQANQLLEEPRFYNTLTANCTTIVFGMMRAIDPGLPLDYRLLLTGYLPEYINELNGLQPGVALEDLRRAGRITERAIAADDAEDFSAQIRRSVPGWSLAQ